MTRLLDHIDARAAEYASLLERWSAINSGTYNLAGLDRMLDELRRSFAALGATETLIDLPPAESVDSSGNIVRTPLGRGLLLTMRPDAPRRVLLNIHYDTVFGIDSPFQQPRLADADTLVGPGVCDAKGGIVTMLAALRAFEEAGDDETKRRVGWEVYLNPDEEIGSPGSIDVLRRIAARHTTALLFEPALPDGSLVGARKGAGNFTAVVRGRAAHAGRDFAAGRSATVALADLIGRFDELNRALGGGITVNCGRIDSGGAVNVVPDLAIGRFNVRVSEMSQMQKSIDAMNAIIGQIAQRDGITVSLHGGFGSPPKVLDQKSIDLIERVRQCHVDLGLPRPEIKSSGGASDGNRLSGAGLAVIDTLGPVGGEIHSDREYVKLSTIAQRAKVVALLLTHVTEETASGPRMDTNQHE